MSVPAVPSGRLAKLLPLKPYFNHKHCRPLDDIVLCKCTVSIHLVLRGINLQTGHGRIPSRSLLIEYLGSLLLQGPTQVMTARHAESMAPIVIK